MLQSTPGADQEVRIINRACGHRNEEHQLGWSPAGNNSAQPLGREAAEDTKLPEEVTGRTRSASKAVCSFPGGRD